MNNGTAQKQNGILSFIYRNRYSLLLFAAVLILCVVPLCFAPIYTGHDLKFHLARISCIADNIGHGKWFSPIYYTHLFGYGYASPLFYGDILLHIPGFLTFLGMSEVKALTVFMMMITASTAFSAYFCSRKIFKNDLAAFVTAVAYTFSSYYCVDMLVRTALGELQAFIFLPVIALGIWSVVYGDRKHWLCLPLGLAACLLSHVMTALVAVVCLTVFCVLSLDKLIRKPKSFLYIAVSAAVFFAVSAFFAFPLLEQYTSYDFALNNGRAALQWGTLAERAMPLTSLLSDNALGGDPWTPNGTGLFPLAAIAAGIAACVLGKRADRACITLSAAGIVCLLLTTNLFPWGNDAVQSAFGSLQFPWRLIGIATLLFAFAAGAAIRRLCSEDIQLRPGIKITATAVTVAAVAFLSVLSYIVTGSGMYKNMLKKGKSGKDVVIDFAATIGGGEYVPTYFNDTKGEWVSSAQIKANIKARGSVITSANIPASKITYEPGYGEGTAVFEGNTSANAYLEFPFLNYKGYTATLDGKSVPVTYGKNSTVRVYVGDAAGGTVRVKYTGTAVQTVSLIISVISVAAVIAYAVIRKRRFNVRAKADA